MPFSIAPQNRRIPVFEDRHATARVRRRADLVRAITTVNRRVRRYDGCHGGRPVKTARWTDYARISTLAVVVVAVAACAGTSGRAAHGHGASAPHAQQVADTRRQLSLAPAQRDAVLAEMRTMLGSVSGVLHGLSANDHQAIDKAASASGMAMAVDPGLEQKLPREFLELGMGTHRKFDQLADLAARRAPADQLVRSLADVTTNCVACHAMYRF
jgi:hypothetical protein